MFRYAMANMARRLRCTLFTLLVAAAATAAVSVTWSVSSMTREGVELSRERLGADILIYPADAAADGKSILFTGMDQMVYLDERETLERIPREMAAAVTGQLFIKSGAVGGCCDFTDPIRIVGVDPSTDFILRPWLDSGEISSPEGKRLVAGYDLGRDMLGKTFVYNEYLDVAGKLGRTGTGMDESVFVDIALARRLAGMYFDTATFGGRDPRGLVTCFLVKLKDGADADSFISSARELGMRENIVSIPQERADMQQRIANIVGVMSFFTAAVIALAVTALFSHFSAMTSSRMGEIGYLRASGVTRGGVFALLAAEALLPALAGGLLGGAVSCFLTSEVYAMLRSTAVIPAESWSTSELAFRVLASAASSLAIGAAAVIIPAGRIASAEPYTMISSGGMQ